MLYIVKQGDTLNRIATSQGTTVDAILAANVLCSPETITVGMPLSLPAPGEERLLKAGAWPYYVVNNGDTLSCLAGQFKQSLSELARANGLSESAALTPGMELLAHIPPSSPEELYASWNIKESQCEWVNPLWSYHVFHMGAYVWEAIGEHGVPYLLKLIKHPCDVVREHAVVALGKIGTGQAVMPTLQEALQDPSPYVAEKAKLALKRVQLVRDWKTDRVHVTTYDTPLLQVSPDFTPITTLPQGTPVFGLRWNLPAPEERTIDLVYVAESGQTGYIARTRDGGILMI